MKERILSRFRNDPVTFLAKLGIYDCSSKGDEVMACCPLHSESRASFSINVQTGLWHCFAGCGGGDLFSLYREINTFEGTFHELLRELEQL